MSNPDQRVTVKSEAGTVSGSVSYYAEADPRIMKIFERYCNGKVDGKAVFTAVSKITGQQRVQDDWKKAGAPDSWIRGPEVFEEWLAKQPPAHCRIYGNPSVIAQVIVQSKENE